MSPFVEIEKKNLNSAASLGSFIRILVKDPVGRHLVRAIVELAPGLHVWTVAEFVADAETLRVLRELGVTRSVNEILRQNAGGKRLRA